MAVGVWLVAMVLYFRHAREMMTGNVSTSSIIYFGYGREVMLHTLQFVELSYTMRATSRIAVCQPQQRSSIVRYTKYSNWSRGNIVLLTCYDAKCGGNMWREYRDVFFSLNSRLHPDFVPVMPTVL